MSTALLVFPIRYLCSNYKHKQCFSKQDQIQFCLMNYNVQLDNHADCLLLPIPLPIGSYMCDYFLTFKNVNK